MTENELLSAADIIITETAHDKNSGGRLGSLFKSIIQFFSNKVTIVEDSIDGFNGALEQEIADRENEDNRRLFLCNLDVLIPLEVGFYTLQTAIEAVTGSTALSGRIIPGFELRFKTSASVVHSFIYNGGDKYDTLSWQSNIVEIEKTARIAGDNALQTSIENLSGEIGSESLARTAGDNALQASIENLSGEIGSESLARTAGDNALQAFIENLSGEIGSESLARTAGDNSLQASIENLSGEIGSESLARTAGDNALQVSIDNLSGEIGSESLARTAGDNALQASIDQEISDRQTAIQGVVQTVISNTEEIDNEITNRTQTVNALRNELLSKTIGSIETGAEQKPSEGSRRYRFTNDGNCYFTDVLNGLTSDVMPVPFQVSKDDELSVIQYGENYIYRYFSITTELKDSIGSIDTVLGILTGDISGDIDLAIQEMTGV